jgi:hypothetical protein
MDETTPRECGRWHIWHDREPSGPAALKVIRERQVSHSRLSQQSCELTLHGRRRSFCTPNHAWFLAFALKEGVTQKECRKFSSEL